MKRFLLSMVLVLSLMMSALAAPKQVTVKPHARKNKDGSVTMVKGHTRTVGGAKKVMVKAHARKNKDGSVTMVKAHARKATAKKKK